MSTDKAGSDQEAVEKPVGHRLSMIICAYTEERWEDLIRSIDAATQALSAHDQLILVIDHNESLLGRVQDHVRCTAGREVIITVNAGKRGLSGARNSGIARATGDVVAFIDDDAAVLAGWREALVGHYGDPDVAAVGGYAEPVWPCGRPDWLPAECDWIFGCSYAGLPTTLSAVRNMMGCNMSFRRDTLMTVGGFNTDLGRVGKHPVGCEETEFCVRISQSWPAKKILFDPDVRVAHYVSTERIRLRYLIRRCFGEGISKRQMSRLVGSRDATSTERAYLLRAVPLAMLRSMGESLSAPARRARPGGAARAAVLALSVVVAGAGYLYAIACDGRPTKALGEVA